MRPHEQPTAVVVNDDATQLRLMSVLLEKDGLRVVACQGGEEALDVLRRQGPVDVIVTDLYMPGIDGWRFCHLLRSPEYADCNRIPILVVSATFSGSEAEAVTAELGANAFLPIPYSPSMFQARVRALLEGRTPPVSVHVLIVEDDAALCEMLAHTFETHGYTAYAATTGEKGRQLYGKVLPQIAILDYFLPDMKADRLLDEFKRPGSPTVVIVITGDASPDTALQVMRRGADAYVRKPFSPSYLIELCQRARRERSLLRVEELLEARTRELRQSEEQYRTLIENLGEGIALVDPQERFTFTNLAMERIFGLPPESLVGRALEDFTDPDQFAAIRQQTEVRRSGRKSSYEFDIIRPDGQRRQLLVTATPQFDDEGRFTGAFGIFRDITERKRAEAASKKRTEQAIRHQAALLELARMDNADLNAALRRITEVDSKTLSVERVSVWLFNQEHSEIVCRDVYTQSHNRHEKGQRLEATQYPIYFQALEESRFIATSDACADPRTSEFTDEYLKPHGITSMMDVPIRLHGKVVGIVCHEHTGPAREWSLEEQDFAGSIADMVSLALETWERQQAEAALAAEKERLAVTLRSIGDGVITTDTQGNIVLLNKVAEALTGWTQPEAAGKPLAEVFHIIDEKTRRRCENPVEKVLSASGRVSLNDTILVARDGSERVIANRGAPIHDIDRHMIGVVLVFHDITEKRKMEQELLKAQKLESLGLLAGGIAHDFNNILMAILGNISLAKMVASPADQIRDKLSSAEKATLRAKELTQQLLTFSKGGAPIKKTASIAEIIKDSAEFALSGSNVQCEFAFQDNLWLVEVDEGQISQVINNLMINADQAMPNGGTIVVRAENITLGAEPSLPLQPGDYVRITIADQGIGIPAGHLPNIFDPYFSTKQKGSGLGLATAYSIIKRHEGTITVESRPNVGSTFTIYLPASDEEIQSQTAAPLVPLDGKGKILVMDDEAFVREVAVGMLTQIGYEVEEAHDGSEAIALYQQAKAAGEPFDAVIMDLTIPGGMGGREAIRRLLEIDPQVKAIVSSGYSNDPIMAEFERYGFCGVMAKPYRIEEVSQVLQRVMNGSQ